MAADVVELCRPFLDAIGAVGGGREALQHWAVPRAHDRELIGVLGLDAVDLPAQDQAAQTRRVLRAELGADLVASVQTEKMRLLEAERVHEMDVAASKIRDLRARRQRIGIAFAETVDREHAVARGEERHELHQASRRARGLQHEQGARQSRLRSSEAALGAYLRIRVSCVLSLE